MKSATLIVLLAAFFQCCTMSGLKAQAQRLSLIPQPAEVLEKAGSFNFSREVPIFYNTHDSLLQKTVAVFIFQLDKLGGFQPEPRAKQNRQRRSNALRLVLNDRFDQVTGKEGYRLSVSPTGIIIRSNDAQGIFYGLQTLLQMIPGDASQTKSAAIPCVEIIDYPRFGYRGLMLDVSRHFFTKNEVKRYIDQMVQYKYNVFHWHLTDDQGWRVEIKSLPRLTEIGAWRVPRTGAWGSFTGAEPGEKATDGGYYTQKDVREIVQYAADRFVTVLPEIDVPAHSLALIAAYPHLSCTGKQYQVSPGTDFYKHEDNALCPGNDSSYIIMDKILGEIAYLFPAEYLHIGGDEAYKGFWENCDRCKQRMKEEHLPNSTALQSYFIRRMADLVRSKNKKMIGWDEILEGGSLPSDVAVMSRYGDMGTKDATRKDHKTVVSPWGYAYWDLYQGDPALEPLTYGQGRLRATYQYDILPDSVDGKMVLGGQGSLWTEFVPTMRHAEYMTWPRSFALSEILWSKKEHKNWPVFVEKVERHFRRFDSLSVNYAKSLYDPYVQVTKNPSGQLNVRLLSELDDVDIYYTFDETNPDQFSQRYTGANLVFPKGATRLKVTTYRNGSPLGKILNVTSKQLEERIK